jgi:DNA repair protein RAD5
MNDVELEQRPKKKRRFFVDDSPPAAHKELPDAAADSDPVETDDTGLGTQPKISESTFDVDVLSSFLGERVSDPVVAILCKLSKNNLERGISDQMSRDQPR